MTFLMALQQCCQDTMSENVNELRYEQNVDGRYAAMDEILRPQRRWSRMTWRRSVTTMTAAIATAKRLVISFDAEMGRGRN
jgi:hypothetical protein